MQFGAKQIAPPKDWETFESLCHALFKRVWNDPFAQKNGRKGQAQHGVDIFGSLNRDRQSFWGVQCKGKDRNLGSKLEWSEIVEEVTKAEGFSPKLDRLFFATTGPSDATLQRAARELSAERAAKSLFSVDVLSWEEIQALISTQPTVIAEFYPEHVDRLPQVVEALQALPSIEASLRDLVSRIHVQLPLHLSSAVSSAWEAVSFGEGRGLGPALMGYSLGPSDVATCPRFVEVDDALAQLRIGYSVRITGQPGVGKSICAYQIASELALDGYQVFRLADLQADTTPLEAPGSNERRVLLVDDAHLMPSAHLERLEGRASSACLVVSTHNDIERFGNRGAIALDAKRAVKTIAAELRSDLPKTLEAVRVADDRVGERMSHTDLGERIDEAESVADRPWQFCFVLGGGWRRSKQSADSARVAGADLVLAAVSIRQLVSSDAQAVPSDIAEICSLCDVDFEAVDRGLTWLQDQRLIISAVDCRTPHQRFASVVLNRILEGQDDSGRRIIASMIEGALCDQRHPYSGARVLVHELRFGSHDFSWTRLLRQSAVESVVARCWSAEGKDRNWAALTLAELWDFLEGGATAAVEPYVATLATWIANPADGAYGFGRILNDLGQRDQDVAARVLAVTDPATIAAAFSNATPDTAYVLAEFLRSVASVKAPEFNLKVTAALDRNRLRELAVHEEFLKNPIRFSKLCAAVLWLDEDFALELAELFLPTAQRVLAEDPVEGFNQLSHDLASTVLRVFDVLGVYVGEFQASPRQREIARRLCMQVDPKRVAEAVSSVRPRHFQSAAFLLSFLSKSAPRKFEAALRRLDWEKLDTVIGDDWKNMPHDTEVLLGTLYSRPATRHLVQKLIESNAHRIVDFPPRLMLIAPTVGLAHVAKGVRLAAHNHVSWALGGGALAVVAEAQPELVEQVVAPFVEALARAVTRYSFDRTGPAEGLVRIVIECAPHAWNGVLDKLDPADAESNLIDCIRLDTEHRRTAAAVIESAIARDDAVGDKARRLRARFPKASIPSIEQPQIARRPKRNRPMT